MISKATARAFAQQLLEEHAAGVSYEKIAERYPCDANGKQIIKRGTLGRIAKSEGEYMPKDKTILAALGLLEKKKKPQQLTPEWWDGLRNNAVKAMARDTRKALKLKQRKVTG